MSKERELLEKIFTLYKGFSNCSKMTVLLNDAKDLLAQPEQEPEQEPVAWMSEETGDVNKSRRYFKLVEKYQNETIVPLYTSPPLKREPFRPDWVSYRQGLEDSKREPLSASTIEHYLLRLDSDFKWDSGFEAGVKWAEKAHGIGVEE